MKPYLLGLNIGNSDPSATLFHGAEMIAHAEEERFIRVKKAYKHFPTNAIRYCLSFVPNGLQGIEAINLGFDLDMYTKEVPLHFLEEWSKHGKTKPQQSFNWERKKLEEMHPTNVRQRIERELRDGGLLEGALPPLHWHRHHDCHAYCAHLGSPFERSLAVIIDGVGEIDTASVYDCDGTRFELLHRKTLPESLGWIYRAFTLFCGFEAHEGEGKLMGLAPYGRPDPALDRIMEEVLIWEEDETGAFDFRVNPEFLYMAERDPEMPMLTRHFVETFGAPCQETSDPPQAYKDLAYAFQDRFEKTLERYVRRFLLATGHRNLTLAGGVFLNCKANGHIWRECRDLLDDIYIMPMSGDDGIGMGANMAYALEHLPVSRNDFSLQHVFLGSAFDNDAVRQAAAGFRLRAEFLGERQYAAVAGSLDLDLTAEAVRESLGKTGDGDVIQAKASAYLSENLRRLEDAPEAAARLLAEGKVIAWFQGRMEAGPRALGCRSILADPRNTANRDRVNEKVKFREAWRPFCPSVLAERADDYFEMATQSPYMINTFTVKPRGIEEAPAIVHVDETARPQFLEAEANPRFHRLIEAFAALTGVPIVLNTSMNIKGEPICCTPDDAFQFFFATDIDALVIGDWLVEKAPAASGSLDSSGEESGPVSATGL